MLAEAETLIDKVPIPSLTVVTHGKSSLRFQPIAEKYKIFLFFLLVHTEKARSKSIIPYESEYKTRDRSGLEF
jgi:hypothetical protein